MDEAAQSPVSVGSAGKFGLFFRDPGLKSGGLYPDEDVLEVRIVRWQLAGGVDGVHVSRIADWVAVHHPSQHGGERSIAHVGLEGLGDTERASGVEPFGEGAAQELTCASQLGGK